MLRHVSVLIIVIRPPTAVSYSAREAEERGSRGEGGGREDTLYSGMGEDTYEDAGPIALARSACEEKRGRSGNLR